MLEKLRPRRSANEMSFQVTGNGAGWATAAVEYGCGGGVHPGMLRYVDVDGTERATENRAILQWWRFGGWVGAVLDRLYVSMVSRYVRNMTKFKNNEQPGTIPAPPRTRPHRRRHPPYPVPSSALSHTLEHLTASHSPPLGIPKQCPSLHPRGHTCQDYTRPRPRRLVPRISTAHQARRQRLPALYSPTVTTPPM